MNAAAATRLPAPRLKPRNLAAQLAALVVVEILLFANYSRHDASFHWATHFLAGVTAAALFNLAWLMIRHTPAPGQIVSILAAHLIAMFPDFLFGAGIPHHAWMDVFLAHVSAHEMPGGERGWLAVALGALGVYAVALSRWIAGNISRGT